MNAADIIKDRVSIPQALSYYGVELSPKGRIPCPIHRGEHKNFAYTQDRFICFVCGAHGSVIDLVMQLFDLSYSQALVRLDEDFSLGLLRGRGTLEERRRAKAAAEKRALELQKLERDKLLYQQQTAAYLAEFRGLNRITESCRPTWDGSGQPPELPQEWAFAFHRIPAVGLWLEMFENFDRWEALTGGGDTGPGIHAGRFSRGHRSL